MMKVWLSSTYYLDEAVLGLSPNAERFFTRAWAYCGAGETSGYINEVAINMLGLANPKKLVRELVAANILEPQPDGRWYFTDWPEVNKNGDALVARRKADRERQARHREQKSSRPDSRDTSREKSRDVTGGEEKRIEENSGQLPESATDSNGRDPGGVSATIGAQLLTEAGVDPKFPDSPKLRSIANELVKAGSAPTDIVEALIEWKSRTGVGPGFLRTLVTDVQKARQNQAMASTPGGTGKVAPSKRKVNAALDLANQFANQPSAQPALEAR